ncbi:MAG: TIGR03936 family radical SAM-associated protein [Clostridia bacterium]|nr:TIGR03936 family radical SAM-associated protein [Clostridia bacterium]
MSDERFIYRLGYTKGERVKYISHLDFLRCVNRSFKRAKVPVKYSQGFNPHILLNIGLPCPVGVSSICEELDIELTTSMETDEIINRMNSSLPDAIKVLWCKRKENEPDFYDIEYARYSINFSSDKDFDTDAFSKENEIMIEKKSKRGMKEVNIKDFIAELKISKIDEGKYFADAIISAGNKLNLKPDLLVSALSSYYGVNIKDVYIERKEIFYENVK